MDDSGLEELLSEHHAEGDWDSRGSFTTIASKALSKLASYQLPRTSAWVLKFVQAAVVASCSSLRFESESISSELKVTFEGGDFGSFEQLTDAWTSPVATVSLAQKHLLVGLRAVSISQKRRVNLGWYGPDGVRGSVAWTGLELADLRSQPGKQPKFAVLSFIVRPGPDNTNFSGWAKEVAELQSFAVACPIPLYLDGEMLGMFGMEDQVMVRKPILSGFLEDFEGSQGALFPVHDVSEERYAAAWTLYRHVLQARGVVSWVQYGVVCQEEEFGERASWQLRLFLPADHLETDLTGLHLRFPEENSVKKSIGHAVSAVGYQISKDSSQISTAIDSLHNNEELGVWAVIGLAMATSLTLIPVLHVFSLGAGVVSGLGFRLFHRAHQQRTILDSRQELQRWCHRQQEIGSR